MPRCLMKFEGGVCTPVEDCFSIFLFCLVWLERLRDWQAVNECAVTLRIGQSEKGRLSPANLDKLGGFRHRLDNPSSIFFSSFVHGMMVGAGEERAQGGVVRSVQSIRSKLGQTLVCSCRSTLGLPAAISSTYVTVPDV